MLIEAFQDTNTDSNNVYVINDDDDDDDDDNDDDDNAVFGEHLLDEWNDILLDGLFEMVMDNISPSHWDTSSLLDNQHSNPFDIDNDADVNDDVLVAVAKTTGV